LRDNVESGLRAIRGSSSSAGARGSGSGRGDVQVVELDWEEVASTGRLPSSITKRGIEIITTTDTLYSPHLVLPLLKTLKAISSLPNTLGKTPTIYIALERRDSQVIDDALTLAEGMGLGLRLVGKGRLGRCLRDCGWGWKGDDWEGVEVWKGRFRLDGRETDGDGEREEGE